MPKHRWFYCRTCGELFSWKERRGDPVRCLVTGCTGLIEPAARAPRLGPSSGIPAPPPPVRPK